MSAYPPASVTPTYDFLIIGAGVVGAALARELSRFEVSVGVVEQAYDVGDGVSKANSSILHTGFDARPGSVEAGLVVRGSRAWQAEAESLGVPIQTVGACMLALDAEQAGSLETWQDNARRNGVTDTRMLSREEVLARVPAANPSVLRGLWIPRESVTCTFTATIALAEHAAVNGVAFHLGQRVRSIRRDRGVYQVRTEFGTLAGRWLVNSAGLWADDVAGFAGRNGFTITPRKGEFLVLDKTARATISHILLPVPTPVSKGILVTPTANGNVLLGPSADDMQDKWDRGVTPDGLRRVRLGALSLAPGLANEPVIATYAGLRPVSSSGDYIVEVDQSTQAINVAGIRSTGLTSAIALAREVCDRLVAGRSGLRERASDLRPRPLRVWAPGSPRPCSDPARVRVQPSFGRIVCHCEAVSEGEIREALRTPLPVTTLDGVKRRTWATAGRCQGFYCMAAVLELIAQQLGVPLSRVTKSGPGSEMVSGPARKGLAEG